ncbi:hypothetical protein CLOP_g13538, partial [Closterium sp. NIES-67]
LRDPELDRVPVGLSKIPGRVGYPGPGSAFWAGRVSGFRIITRRVGSGLPGRVFDTRYPKRYPVGYSI